MIIKNQKTKICTKCRKEYVATEENFYKFIKGRFGLHYWCKNCYGLYFKNRYIKNKDKIRKQQKKYCKSSRGKEVRKEINKRYSKSEKGKISSRNRNKRYKISNKFKVNARNAKRRSIKLEQTPIDARHDEIIKIYKICSDMNSRTGKILFHVDHIIPLSKGGLHHEDNLQILWWKDNLKKSDKIWRNTNGRHS